MDRREALGFLAGGAASLALPAVAQPATLHARPVPSSGERLPCVGLGTWLTFDVGPPPSAARKSRGDVLQAFFAAGGRVVDSSPMYGSSEAVIGAELARLGRTPVFAASKVWTMGGLAGRRQVETSRKLWGLERFDLLQVHNLLDWETHWPMLKEMKAQGRVRSIGMTTSHGRRHDDLEKILRSEKLDFVQFTYNVADPQVERVLLPLAADRGTAVIVNRPFDGGDLFGAKTAGPLPGWAKEIGVASWAEALLKWVIAHPAVTVAIPATSKVDHLQQNMGALAGPLPDAALRKRIAEDHAKA